MGCGSPFRSCGTDFGVSLGLNWGLGGRFGFGRIGGLERFP